MASVRYIELEFWVLVIQVSLYSSSLL